MTNKSLDSLTFNSAIKLVDEHKRTQYNNLTEKRLSLMCSLRNSQREFEKWGIQTKFEPDVAVDFTDGSLRVNLRSLPLVDASTLINFLTDEFDGVPVFYANDSVSKNSNKSWSELKAAAAEFEESHSKRLPGRISSPLVDYTSGVLLVELPILFGVSQELFAMLELPSEIGAAKVPVHYINGADQGTSYLELNT